jgi:YVTN family beta-propeller protein
MQGRRVLASLVLPTAALAVDPATAATGHPPGDDVVYVTEREAGSVTAFDAATGAVIWTRPTGATPIGVTVPAGTGKLYTSDEGADQMSVFDAETGEPVTEIPTGHMPHHLMASRDGSRLYVAEFGQNTVAAIDTRTDELLAHLDSSALAEARTHAVYVTDDGEDLYTTNTREDRTQVGDVGHIDAATGELLCNTPVGVDPSEILVTADGRIGYVSVRGENEVKELDLSADCPVLTERQALVGAEPDTLQLTPDGTTLVVTLRGTPAQIALLDVDSFSARVIEIPGHVKTGHNGLSSDPEWSYVAVEQPAGFVVVDNASGEVVADHPYPDTSGGTEAHGLYVLARTSRRAPVICGHSQLAPGVRHRPSCLPR